MGIRINNMREEKMVRATFFKSYPYLDLTKGLT